MISLSFPARLRIGGEGTIGSAAEAPDVTRERRALRVWPQQLHALIDASCHTDIEWQIYLLQWTILRGQPGERRREIDTERLAVWLRDPEPFCDRLSTWSGMPATRLRLAADIDR